MTSFGFISASIFGFTILTVLTVSGLVGSIHFTKKICGKQTTNDTTKTTTTRIFRCLCVVLLWTGTAELFIIVAGYFVYSRVINLDGTIFSIFMRTFHGFCAFLLSLLFILRLHATLEGSSYNYPSKFYKFIVSVSSINMLLGFLSLVLFNLDAFFQELYQDSLSTRNWYIPFISKQIVSIILMISMTVYLTLQVILVALLISALRSVRLLRLNMYYSK